MREVTPLVLAISRLAKPWAFQFVNQFVSHDILDPEAVTDVLKELFLKQ